MFYYYQYHYHCYLNCYYYKFENRGMVLSRFCSLSHNVQQESRNRFNSSVYSVCAPQTTSIWDYHRPWGRTWRLRRDTDQSRSLLKTGADPYRSCGKQAFWHYSHKILSILFPSLTRAHVHVLSSSFVF